MCHPLNKELSLDDKIALTENILIEEYMRTNGNLYLSFSMGKDSQVLRHIALRLFPDLRVVFSNTTNELKEIMEHAKTFPNIITVFPSKSFKKVLKEVGLPLVSKEVSQKINELKNTNGLKTRLLRKYGGYAKKNKVRNSKLANSWQFVAEQKFDVSSKCCDILKKLPLEKWAKENGNPKPIIALMRDESSLRNQLGNRLESQLALYGKDDGKKIYPFLNTGWTEADIWEYSSRAENKMRFAECYYDRIVNGVLIKAVKRTGCEYCGFGIMQEEEDKFARSKLLAPKKYEKIMAIENNGVSFRDAIDIVKKGATSDLLGISGGVVTNFTVDSQNMEVFNFKVTTKPNTCNCCKSKRPSKKKDTGITYAISFIDMPNQVTGRKRVVTAEFDFYECMECGMTINNHLHMFDLRFNVTKRLIDYIYDNMNKKSSAEIIEETGLTFDQVFGILSYYEKPIRAGLSDKQKAIWFDKDNRLIA